MGNFAYYKIGQPWSAKLCRSGFCGFVDTMECVFEMYKDMAKIGVLPGPKVEAARPKIQTSIGLRKSKAPISALKFEISAGNGRISGVVAVVVS